MDNQRGDIPVDDILKELKTKPGAPASGIGKSVDDILAEMGKGTGKKPPTIPPPPSTAKAAPPPAQPAVAPAPAPAAAPAPVAEAVPAAAPVVEAAPVAEAPPVSEFEPEDYDFSLPKAGIVIDEVTEDVPAEAPAEDPKAPKKRRNKDLEATIYDIDLNGQPTEIGPRMGKAAALDKVAPDKYAGDTELLSWFSGEGDEDAPMPTSKKEQKQIEKMKRKREAAERKEEKRRARLGLDDAEPAEVADAEDAPEAEDDVKVWPGKAAEADAPIENGFFREEAPAPAPVAAAPKPEPAPVAPTPQSAAPPPKPAAAAPQPVAPAAAQNPAPAARPVAPPPQKPVAPAPQPVAPVATQNPAPTASQPVARPAAPPPQKPVATAPVITPAAPAAPKVTPPSMDAPTRQMPATTPPTVTRQAPVVSPAPATVDNAPTRQMPAVTPQPGQAAPAPAAVAAPAATAAAAAAAVLAQTADIPDHDTKSFDLEEEDSQGRVPTAAFTQEFDTEEGGPEEGNKNLYVDEMVDDRFREFFSETVIMDSKEVEQAAATKGKRRRKKSRSAVLTGEFGKLAQQAEQAERAAAQDNVEGDDDFEDYDRPQDAEAVEQDIASLCTTLTRRTVGTAILGVLLLWMGASHAGLISIATLQVFDNNPLVFAIVYLALLLVAIIINFTTVATGIVGLAGEPTVDSPPALAAVAGLLQGVLLLVNALGERPPVHATLLGTVVAFILAFNALGKRVRAGSILRNFQLASAGFDHSAAYVLDNSNELSYSITKGLAEEYPTLLISRPTALVKGFLRQSFSQRATDRRARFVGWVLLGVSLVAGVIAWLLSEDLFTTVSAFAATLCISVPFSSSLVSGVPSTLLQKGTSRVGAVVPGWSAIEELGGVNVVMAGCRDIFPPNAVQLKGIKTFEKERIDLAILYAASVLIEGCDTLRDIFLGVIQGKSDMLYKVESLTIEPGRGFTAWVQNSRIVIGSREMLQKHDIEPPAIEVEMKFVPEGSYPVYLAVSGKLFAMFIVSYSADDEVAETLQSLVRSGVSLLIQSSDMNVSAELVERVYDLPAGVVKVLGHKELEIMEPLTGYLPESEGVMTHIGSFASFIGGMRAAASCAAAEKMSNIVQIASAVLACALCILLVLSQGLTTLSVFIVLLYQLGWTLLVSLLPFLRKY